MSAKPAKQVTANSQDTHAVGIIMTILGGHDRVVPDIKTIDKYPNIDGHIQIKDKDDYPVGTIAVTVKPINVERDGLLFDCPVTILAYAAIDPTILLGVDKQTEKIYWMYLDSYELRNIDYEDNESTKRIEFEPDHVISKSHKEYIEHWSAIASKNQLRLTGYDAKEEELTRILASTNRIVGKREDNFISLHHFIDELNGLLDRDFPTVKKFFYPSAWKVGIAYEKYEEGELAYSLYPIHISQNDVQIKEIDDALVKAIRGQGLGFTAMMEKNPIMTRPKEYAKELIGEDVMKLVNHKLLRTTGSDTLAREFIFAFLDKFQVQLGMMPEVADREKMKFINFAFGTYFPAWIEEAYQLLILKRRNNIEERVARKGYYDPDVLSEIMPDELKEIQSKVGKRLNQQSATYRVANPQLDVGVFAESLAYFNAIDSEGEIERLYRKADRSRIARIGSHWIWDQWSKEDAEVNFQTVMNSLPTAYAHIVKVNFPNIAKELDLFKGANVIYVFADIKEKYTGRPSGPTYSMFYIKEPGRRSKSIEMIDAEAAKKYEEMIWSKAKRDDAPFKIISASSSLLSFLYNPTPLADLTYALLAERLKDYFQLA